MQFLPQNNAVGLKQDPEPDPHQIRIRIRIRTKMSRIRTTGFNCVGSGLPDGGETVSCAGVLWLAHRLSLIALLLQQRQELVLRLLDRLARLLKTREQLQLGPAPRETL